MNSTHRRHGNAFEVRIVEQSTGIIHTTWIFVERDVKSLLKDRNKGNWSAVRAGCDTARLFYGQWVPVDTPPTCLHCAAEPV